MASKEVLVAGTDDKRCITIVVGSTLSGELLPFQVIYDGKSARSLPREAELNDAR